MEDAALEYNVEDQASQWAFAPFDIAAAWALSWTGYATNAFMRRATPAELFGDANRFWRVATTRPHPTWSTRYKVARTWPIVRLLDFSTEPNSDVIPTVILPPQAGHAATIVDYTEHQSQVRTALSQGLTRLFVIDWRSATEATKNTTIEDYFAIMDEVVERLGGRVNLVGDCQGGWFGAIYAALHPESVNSLTIGAAPIDYLAGKSAIHQWDRFMATSQDPMRAFRMLVDTNGGVYEGDNQIMGFKMMQPAGEQTRLADLWANIGDEQYVRRYLEFTSWFETPQNLPGAFYLWTVEHLFKNNELIAGVLEVGGQIVDLGRITCPVYMLAGSEDHITPPEQVWALGDHISTPDKLVQKRYLKAGHLGLFMGRFALNEHWTPVFKDIHKHSVPKKPTAKAPLAKVEAPAVKTKASVAKAPSRAVRPRST